jgi:formylglycine-generating enzyme required for sulfatase activity
MITASIYGYMALGVESRADEEGYPVPVEGFCFVEAGDYPVGGENHTVFVERFLIGRTPVTNRQFGRYLEATQRSDPHRSD